MEAVGNTLKFKITSAYGAIDKIRNNKPHTGIDFALPEGEKVRSIYDGVVTDVIELNEKSNLGNGVLVKFEDGTTGIFGHLSKISVEEGQKVSAGDILGYAGSTGRSSGNHLHFGLKDEAGQIVDPTPIAEQISNMQGEEVSAFGKVGKWFLERGKVDNFQHSDYNFWIDTMGKLLREDFVEFMKYLVEQFTLYLPDILGATTFIVAAALMFGIKPRTTAIVYGSALLGGALWLINAPS